MKNLEWNRLHEQVPNGLTLFRILLIPVFAFAMYLPFEWGKTFAALIFLVAALTDWLDGYLARKLEQTSNFGAFLDPVADKLMVAVALIILVQKHPSVWMALAAAVIIGREITISALREWMAEIGERVSVSFMGKFKTTLQMAALLCLIYQKDLYGVSTYQAGKLLLAVAVALTLWSMFLYLKAAWSTLNKRES